MTTSNEHNNAPAVPQGAPEINYPALIEAAFAKNRKWTQGTTGCIAFARGAEWFREQAIAAAPAPAPAQYKDSTPQLSVGESSFESWFESYNPANKGDKQRSRDAYAAGMGDPLVAAAPAQGEPFGYFRPEPFGWTDCAEDDEGAIALYERPQEVGLTDEEIEAIAQKHMSTVGDHWCNEEAIRERHAEDFARAIIAALRAKGQS